MIITILAQKGGVGKTTSTVNLGAALGGPGFVVDADSQRQDAIYHFSGSIPGVEFLESMPPTVNTFAVVDTSPNIGEDHGEPLMRADIVLLPLVCKEMELRAFWQALRSLEETKQIREARGLSPLKALVLPSMVEKNQYTEGVIRGVRAACPWPVAKTMIPLRTREFHKAVKMRMPIVFQQPDSAGAQAYLALAAEVREHVE